MSKKRPPKKSIEDTKIETRQTANALGANYSVLGLQEASMINLSRTPATPSWEGAISKRISGVNTPFIEGKLHRFNPSPYFEGRVSAPPPSSVPVAHLQTRLPNFHLENLKQQQSEITRKSVSSLRSDDCCEKLTKSIDRLSDRIDRFLQKASGGGGAGGAGGGGGDAGGGGGDGPLLTRQGREESRRASAFRRNIVADVLGGVASYNLAANLKESTAPISTYSNIAKLQGYQQGRFIRDFGNFDAESLVLRHSFMRYAGQDSLARRIDPIAKEAAKKQDRAETNQAFYNSLKNIANETTKGGVAGSVLPGIGTKAGILGGAVSGIAGEIGNLPNNPTLLRNQTFNQDLRMQARTQFDTSTIIANTSALEEAEKEKNKISIYTLQKYQETINPRMAAQEQGRFLDITSQNINKAVSSGLSIQTENERKQVQNAVRKSAQLEKKENAYSSRLKEDFLGAINQGKDEIDSYTGSTTPEGAATQLLGQFFAGSKAALKAIASPITAFTSTSSKSGRLGQLANGDVVYRNAADDAQFKNVQEANKLNKIKEMQAEEGGLQGVLHGMGYAASSQEGIKIISQFGNIGGAGSKGISGTANEVRALNQIKGMSQSGLGSAEQLLGQAGILGRLSGGVSEAGNVKKLEEVMSRAVASGMNNSDLTSAFMQNITSKASEMGTTDVEGVARLVQKMQMTGGGQLADYERMNRSLTGADAASKQNLYVKSNIRANMMNTIESGTNIRGERAAILTQGLDEMSTAQLSELAQNAQQYAKTGKLKKGSIGYNLLSTMQRGEAKQITKDLVKNIKGDRISGMLGMSREDFKSKYGMYPSDYDKLPDQVKTQIRGEASMMQGFDATMFDDSATFSGGKDDYGKKSAVDKNKVSEAEKKLAIRKAQAQANEAAVAMGGASGVSAKVTFKKFLDEKAGGKTLEQLSRDTQFGSVVRGLGLKSSIQYDVAEKMIRGKELSKDEQQVAKEAGLEKKLQQDVFSLGAANQQPQMSTEQGQINEATATLLGAAFAEAFFQRVDPKSIKFNQGKK